VHRLAVVGRSAVSDGVNTSATCLFVRTLWNAHTRTGITQTGPVSAIRVVIGGRRQRVTSSTTTLGVGTHRRCSSAFCDCITADSKYDMDHT